MQIYEHFHVHWCIDNLAIDSYSFYDMDYAFASLAHIRILLLPIGTIQPATFENLASEIGQFVEIRLGDIPADSRDDRGAK